MNIDATNYMNVCPNGLDEAMIRRAGQIAANEAMRIERRLDELLHSLYDGYPRNPKPRCHATCSEHDKINTLRQELEAAKRFRNACERRFGINRHGRGVDGEVYGDDAPAGERHNLWGRVRSPKRFYR